MVDHSATSCTGYTLCFSSVSDSVSAAPLLLDCWGYVSHAQRFCTLCDSVVSPLPLVQINFLTLLSGNSKVMNMIISFDFLLNAWRRCWSLLLHSAVVAVVTVIAAAVVTVYCFCLLHTDCCCYLLLWFTVSLSCCSHCCCFYNLRYDLLLFLGPVYTDVFSLSGRLLCLPITSRLNAHITISNTSKAQLLRSSFANQCTKEYNTSATMAARGAVVHSVMSFCTPIAAEIDNAWVCLTAL